MPLTKLFITTILISLSISVNAQKTSKADKDSTIYHFTMDYTVPSTPVKNQAKTGTCWSFATISFIESEMLRNGIEEIDLSEMYLIRHTYPVKAEKYIRMMGLFNFGEGGQAHDIINQMKLNGIVPEEVYCGMNINETRHNHGEMVSILQSILKAVNEKKGGKVTPRWTELFNAALDIYMGKTPEEFTYKGVNYTPMSFFQNKVKINTEDYIEFTSFTHHPFYETFSLEIPDNWTNQQYYNIPMADLIDIMNNSLKKGYSVLWDGDVTEKFFNQKKGYAVVPLKDWDDKTTEERDAKLELPEAEKNVTQEMHQSAFDNFSTTDDHLMHITGLAHDQNNTKYYYTKNSWGTDYKDKGFIYISEQYAKLNTIAIMVNKNAVPESIRAKCKIK